MINTQQEEGDDQMDKLPQTPTLDSVKSFAEYAGIGMFLAYQYTRAKGFPVIQLRKKRADPYRAGGGARVDEGADCSIQIIVWLRGGDEHGVLQDVPGLRGEQRPRGTVRLQG